MKKTVPLIVISSLLLLACQSNAPLRQSSDDLDKAEKASSSAAVSISIEDPAKPTTAKKQVGSGFNIVMGPTGMSPADVTSPQGLDLNIINGSEKDLHLYTTTDGEKPCPDLGATIDIAPRETKTFKLATVMTCTIMNQYNTNDRVALTVQSAQ